MSQPATLTTIEAMTPHSDADTLSIVKLSGLSYSVVGKTSDWNVGDLVVYVEPDSIVPDLPQYAWLGKRPKHRRIRAKKIRGVWSFGLMVRPTTDELVQMGNVGDDVSEIMGITHYEPQETDLNGGPRQPGERPGISVPFTDFGKFGVENIQREGDSIEAGTLVWVTEKLHGQNIRATVHEGAEYVGTRNIWYARGENACWNLIKVPGVSDMLKMFNDTILYFERLDCQGPDWTYGGEAFRLITMRNKDDATFWPFHAVRAAAGCYGVETVPVISCESYDRERMTALASGDSAFLAQSFREGIVIQSGQTFLKSVSPEYLAS